MPKRTEDQRERYRLAMRGFANRERDLADEVSAKWECDDALHPFMPIGDEQPFRDWIDFVDRVARPLVELEDDETAEQAAMALYRRASPYFICTALLMAANRVQALGGFDANPETGA